MDEHRPGGMDIREQERTFAGFVQALMYLAAVVAVVLLFLAIVNT